MPSEALGRISLAGEKEIGGEKAGFFGLSSTKHT
jgi:hypothetical protein